jgi:hypothetical protein
MPQYGADPLLSVTHPAAPAVVPLHFLLRIVDGEYHWPAITPSDSSLLQTVPQTVPDGLGWQAPLPLHPPYMQFAVDAVHDGSAVPWATGLHVPWLPDTLHDAHFPQDENVQHTPSVQYRPAAHWEVAVHAPPLAVPGAQAAPLQPYAHCVGNGVTHEPLVEHLDWSVK